MIAKTYLRASLPDTRLVTSSGRFSITFDKSMYLSAMIAIGSSTLSKPSKASKKYEKAVLKSFSSLA